MRFEKIVLIAVGAVCLAGAARAEGGKTDMAQLEMLGFKKHFTLPTTSYEHWSHRKDDFLISKEGFSNRADALKFCADQKDFKLGKSILPLMLVMSGYAFPALKDSQIEEKILGGGGPPTSGWIFWANESVPEEKKAISKEPDTLVSFLDGCGPNCASFPTLRDVNAALKTVGKPARKIRAICSQVTSKDL